MAQDGIEQRSGNNNLAEAAMRLAPDARPLGYSVRTDLFLLQHARTLRSGALEEVVERLESSCLEFGKILRGLQAARSRDVESTRVTSQVEVVGDRLRFRGSIANHDQSMQLDDPEYDDNDSVHGIYTRVSRPGPTLTSSPSFSERRPVERGPEGPMGGGHG